MTKSVAVYPGTFDPVTFGHLDLIHRGSTIFDRLIVAVVANPSKPLLFSLDERVSMLREATNGVSNLEIDSFDELLVHYLHRKKTHVIMRGLRAVTDFEYEFEMALTNRCLAEDVETIFLAPSQEYIYLRATLVKEVARYGGDLSQYVPACVEKRLKERFGKK